MAKQEIVNRYANYEYEVLERFEAGVVLTGAEVKSLRMGRAQLKDSFARITEGEAYLTNLHISAYPFARNDEIEPERTRKLLLKRNELEKLTGKLQQKGLSLVPLRIYLKHNRFKVELGLVRGRKQYQKKELKKREDIRREVQRELRGEKYRG
jgi:SsrA-binding protein